MGRAGYGNAAGVSTVSRHVDVPPEKVFRILSDGWLYGLWVVGASHIRGVDDGWPAVGARIHHAVGGWPVLVRDRTVVTRVDPDRRLELSARAWPFGSACVVLTLEPDADGTTIRMKESPTSRIAAAAHNAVTDRLLDHRNNESLARLAALAENRQV